MSDDPKPDEPEPTPPGTFVSEDQRRQTADFLEELRKRLRRKKPSEPRLGRPD